MRNTAYIAGGSKGMGLETAKLLTARNFPVTLITRGAEGLTTAKT